MPQSGSPYNIMTPYLCIIPGSNADHQSEVLRHSSSFLPAELDSFAFSDTNPDLTWFNTDHSGVPIELVRNITAELAYPPYQHSHRVCIICHFDTASIPAQNAFLKSLEEPPEYVQLILTVSSLNAILPTIASRCRVVTLDHTPTTTMSTSGDNGDARLDTATHMSEHVAEVEKLLSATTATPILLWSASFKERDRALELVNTCLRKWHSENQLQPTPKRTSQIAQTLQVLTHLHANANVQLAVEAWLLTCQKM